MLNHDRRRFLKSSLGVSAVVGLTGGGIAKVASKALGTRSNPDNATVVPGLVYWHCDFTTACRAAKGSGKPVMLLHMLGRLDQQFC